MFLQVLLDQCQVCTDNLCYWLPALQEEDGGHGSDLVFPWPSPAATAVYGRLLP